ncbi:MAG: hypothetical protein RLY93_05260 [Sumerlaeia bacterium]
MKLVHERVVLTAESGAIEGLLVYPEGTIAAGRMLLHAPHPLLGGTMDHPVILALLDACAGLGYAALVWQYRVLGESASREAGAAREAFWTDQRFDPRTAPDMADARRVARLLRELPLGTDVGIVAVGGYSYGALIALSQAEELKTPALAVSPPLRALQAPVRLILGSVVLLAENDFAITEEELRIHTGLGRQSPSVRIIPDTDHLFVGQGEALGAEARQWLAQFKLSSSSAFQASSLL